MSVQCFLSLLLLASTLQAQAPTSPPAEAKPAAEAVDCREPIPVPAERKSIEEASLCHDSALAAGNPNQLARQRAGYLVKSQSDSAPSMRTGMVDMEADAANGMRVYTFRLNPKESLKLKLQAEDNKLMMRFLAPTQVGATMPDIRRANVPPTAVRRSLISLVNTTGAPADYALLLYGSVGHKFKLDIERTSGD